MAAIPCEDFYSDGPGTVPKRPKCTRPGCIADRWANFVASMDPTPFSEDDELGDPATIAWSIWDIPATHVSQIEDEEGNDMIVVAVVNRLYVLDFARHRDEWYYNTFSPIQRMVKFGPIPSTVDDVGTQEGYRLDFLKRFREFAFNMRDNVTAALSSFRIKVGEYENEANNEKAGLRKGRRIMRFKAAMKGQSFVVKVEHAANEPFRLEHWQASWDTLGKRISQAKVTAY